MFRALMLWLRGKVHLGRDPQEVLEDGGERFRSFRKIVVDGGSVGAIVRVRFRFRNLSAAMNRRLSWIPVPLIVAQPGFRSKTWYAGEETGEFIGLYEFASEADGRAYLDSLPLAMMRRRAAEGSLCMDVFPAGPYTDARRAFSVRG
jgi:hypothetical protein